MYFIIECLIATLILFCPLIYGGVTIFPVFIIESLSFLLFFCLILKRTFQYSTQSPRTPIVWLLLFVAFIILQLLELPASIVTTFSPVTVNLFKEFRVSTFSALSLSIYPEATLGLLLQIISYIMVFYVVLNTMDSKEKLSRLVLLIILCGFVYSFYGFLGGVGIGKVPFSTFANRDHFAAFIEIPIFLGIGYALFERDRIKKIIIIFLISVMVLSLFFTFSRAGVLSFSVGIFVFITLLRLRRPVKRWIFVLAALFLFFGALIGFVGTNSVVERLKTLLDPFLAYKDRLNLLVDSMNVFFDFSLLGTGLGTFAEIIQKYNTSAKQVSWIFAHNEPVNLLVETGFIGFLLVFLFFYMSLKDIFLRWFKRRSLFSVYLTLGALSGIIAISFHSLFDFVFHIPANALLLFIVLGLVFRAVYIKEEQGILVLPKIKSSLDTRAKFTLIIITVCGLVFLETLAWRRFAAEAAFRKTSDYILSGIDAEDILQYRKTIRIIDKAIELNRLSSRYLSRKADLLAELFLKGGFRFVFNNEEELFNSNRFYTMYKQIYSQAIDINPTRADYHLRLGWAYSHLRQKRLMESEFDKAYYLDPKNIKLKQFIDQYRENDKK